MREHTQRGFTLIEVLIASVILATGLTVILTAASRCLAVMRIARNYQTAQWTLSLGQLEYYVTPTNEIDDWEVSPVEYPNGLTFSREVEEEDEEDEDELYVVRTRVSWSDKGRESFEEVVQYIHAPEDDDTGPEGSSGDPSGTDGSPNSPGSNPPNNAGGSSPPNTGRNTGKTPGAPGGGS